MIREFQGSYRWLSNFHPSPFQAGGRTWKTVEHFYQAMKFTDERIRQEICNCATPGEAKRLGRKYKLRDDWEEIKQEVMEFALRRKFKPGSAMAARLRSTGDKHIQEGNRWNDRYWGVDLKTGEGENNLGKLLMKIREELR